MIHSERYKLSDFSLIKQLAEGGFWKAYHACRNCDRLDVCLKEIPLNNGISKRAIERDSKMLSELNSQYIIKYNGSFFDLGNFYIVMEYDNEGSLADMITVCSFELLLLCLFVDVYVRVV